MPLLFISGSNSKRISRSLQENHHHSDLSILLIFLWFLMQCHKVAVYSLSLCFGPSWLTASPLLLQRLSGENKSEMFVWREVFAKGPEINMPWCNAVDMTVCVCVCCPDLFLRAPMILGPPRLFWQGCSGLWVMRGDSHPAWCVFGCVCVCHTLLMSST